MRVRDVVKISHNTHFEKVKTRNLTRVPPVSNQVQWKLIGIHPEAQTLAVQPVPVTVT